MADEVPTFELGPAGSLTWHYLRDQTTGEVFSGGSAGPGKTTTLCWFNTQDCLRYPGIKTGIFRATYKDVRESTLVTMFKLVDMLKGQIKEGVHFKFISNQGLWQWYNGSEMLFDYLAFDPGDPDYRKLGGYEFTHGSVDEADQVQERGVTMLASRIGRTKNLEYCHACASPGMSSMSKPIDCDDDGNPTQWACWKCGAPTKGIVPKLLTTGNPGPFWTRGRYICEDDGTPVKLPAHRKAVTMLLKDNPDPGFRASYKQRLEESYEDEYDRARLIDGDWMAQRRTGAEFIQGFDRKVHVQAVEYDPSKPLHCTWDFNASPYMTLLIAQLHEQEDRRWHIAFLQEICLKEPLSTVEFTCHAFAKELRTGKYAGHKAGLFTYGDASGKHRDSNSHDEIYHKYDMIERELRLWLSPANSDRVLRVNPPHVIVRDFYNAGLRGKLRHYYTFHPSMVNTIGDMTNVKTNADGGILKVKIKDAITGIPYEPYGHCLQASYYLSVSAFADEFANFTRR